MASIALVFRGTLWLDETLKTVNGQFYIHSLLCWSELDYIMSRKNEFFSSHLNSDNPNLRRGYNLRPETVLDANI